MTQKRPGAAKRGSRLAVRSVAGQVFVLQLAIVLLLVLAAAAGLAWQARLADVRSARERSLTCAATLALSPSTAAALRSPRPTGKLQPVSVRAGRECGIDFVAVLDRQGVRLSDPLPRLIGKRASGDFSRALAGQSYTEQFEGQPKDSVRAVAPVQDPDGTVIGLVTAGVDLATVSAKLDRELPWVGAGAAGALLLATLGAGLVSRRLNRQTRGLGPAEVTRMYEHHDAVLHAAREGVLVLDGTGRLVLANDEAHRLLRLPDHAQGQQIDDLRLEPGIAGLLASGRSASDEVYAVGDRMLAVNQRPTGSDGGPAGCVATLRDTTELREVAGQAQVAAQRLELLYTAGLRIGTTLDVVRTAEELTEVAVPRFADAATVDLLEPVIGGQEPLPGPSTAAVRRVALRFEGGAVPPLQPVDSSPAVPPLSGPGGSESGREDGTAGGGEGGGRAGDAGDAGDLAESVLEPDLAAATDWRATDPERAERMLREGFHSLIMVPLRARGTVLGRACFWRRDQRAFQAEDLASAEELVTRTAVCVDNARRYAREHGLAVTLQRSLLPGGLPEQNAVSAAYRYLPARAGVGGDWFDVIPLPGARVALVVGDVVGHGLHAAATMGRLRTAVHNFSSLDLPPEELLAHLDELVMRIDQDPTLGPDTAAVTGATVLYAIYDPASGRCQFSGAGHPPPALACPDGTTAVLEAPENLPLGLGASPFETRTLTLPEGSRLALYTNGLVQVRSRDLDERLEMLRVALSGTGQGPEETCAAVLEAMLPDRTSEDRDDIALLVAETRLLPSSRIARWEVPSDPEAVAPVRAACAARLVEWGLEETAFTAELILSELLTNAIRYGAPPVTVRLLCDRYVTCEVSDSSSTAPHLRRATTVDEGGRGLFLIAQLAQHWGTRYTAEGKTIWAELSLDGAPSEVPLV
ncbi:SpoIIE family protein phosphatase [Streptomyces sp. WMMB303]|uniref:SpoIIE family protein phosphatase n=1 Tax=Streptomyces sp. WMMB303 TaxID=3034154 RepID=UPI0023EB02D1|nr:SpoIIE family protein phosphatase [Streptomyces sp. WMMB303]MDF4249064.1 SpoIIE family protein phosphatase [Streptomyces sp. WMMB303]